jgi:hypothetical protein
MPCMSSKQSEPEPANGWHAMPCPANGSSVPRPERRRAAHDLCRKWPRRERLGSAQVILVIHDPMHRTAGQVGCNLTHPLSVASVASPGKWPLVSVGSLARHFAE